MFQPDWLILRILHQSFEIERPKGHWSEVVVHLYTYPPHTDYIGAVCVVSCMHTYIVTESIENQSVFRENTTLFF